MNIQNNLSYYIDATNEFIGGGGGGGGTSSNIIINGGSGSNLNDYLFTSNDNGKYQLYLNTPHTDGDIRFSTKLSKFATNNNYDHSVKIDKDGKLFVYHIYNPLLPTYSAGWKDVENALSDLVSFNISTEAQFVAVGATLLQVESSLGSLLSTDAIHYGLIDGLEAQIVSVETAVAELTTVVEELYYATYEPSDVLTEAEISIRNTYGSLDRYVNQAANFGIVRSVANDITISFANKWINYFRSKYAEVAIGAVIGVVGGIIATQALQEQRNIASNLASSNFQITSEQRRILLDDVDFADQSNMLYLNSNFCNMSLDQGFINSNITNTQFIPSLKSNKILMGNITTPNASYQLEMTGDINTNMLYINSTSLTSLLNQKQGNLTFNNPLLNTTNTITLKRDSSLTLDGSGNLSVVKTATTPLVYTGNDISLNYDNSLTKVGNNLSVAPATASKWTTSGNNIYNNNTGNVGIGSQIPRLKLDVMGDSYFSSNMNLGVLPLNFISSFTNATLTDVSGGSEKYLQYTANGTLILNEPCSCDLLLVGAGGNGGLNAGSGGGGAGEVIYFPNFPLRAGTLNISVGTSSTTFTNRRSKIAVSGGSDVIIANGGGDGGYYTFSFVRQYPPKAYNSLSSETANTSINGRTCYRQDLILNTTGITYGSGTYELYYIPTIANYNHGTFKFFDFSKNGTDAGGHIGGGGLVGTDSYNSTTGYYTGNNYLVSSSYKGAWFVIKLPVAILLSSYKIYLRDGCSHRFPKDFIIYGSNDSSNWDIVDNIVGTLSSISNGYIYTSSTLTPSKTYIYYGLVVNRVYTATTPDGVINPVEIEFFGSEITQEINPSSGGSGGGGSRINNQLGAIAGTKFDANKSYSQAGFNGTASSGGNGGSCLSTGRYTANITGSSFQVGGGGSGVGNSPPVPSAKLNYGDGGDGNSGVGFQGVVIIRFKEPLYLQLKTTLDNANTGLILNANAGSIFTQMRLYPYSEIYPATGTTIRGFSMRTQDGNNNYDLLNLLATFGGRVGVKTKIPLATFDVNGDIKCKQLFIEADEPYGVSCQLMNLSSTGQSGFFIGGGQAETFGGINLFYDPFTQIAELNNGSSSANADLLLKIYNSGVNNGYIRIANSTGNVGIGTPTPVSKLDVNGNINSTSITTGTMNSSSVSTSSISMNNGNISLANIIGCTVLNAGPISCSSINLTGGNITNGGTFNGTCTQARYLLANTNEWHISKDNRQRFYFTDDTTTPSNSHTVIKTGSLTTYFQDKDGTDYCLLDRFGISTYFEVVSGGNYDNIGGGDASYSGVYIYRRMVIRLSTFTEVHRCFIEDELYDNYDDFIDNYIGRIVVSKGKIKTALKKEKQDWEILEGKEGITIDDSHPVVELSRTKKNKAVVGVITKRESQDYPGRLVINSLGETGIWIVNSQNIETGDLITTSSELGYGEKQVLEASGDADDIIRNYTIGKCMIDCNFELDSPNYKCEVIDVERDLRRAFLPIFIYSG